jgi:GMP synthase (glutamine-hydrolysing)
MNSHQPILIIKAGTKLPSLAVTEGDFEQWIMTAMGRSADAFVVADANGESLPAPATISAVVITGSGAMVTDRSGWIEYTAAWLRELTDRPVPVLGICFGHQLLAYALGGTVMNNPQGVEVGTVEMHLTDAAVSDPLFTNMHDMPVQASHRQAVMELPSAAMRLATTDMDGNHAFRYGDIFWGVQFHPEFNAAITKKYIEYYRQDLLQAGIDPVQKKQACHETVTANKILQRFSELAGG